jgi:hypothetical protein
MTQDANAKRKAKAKAQRRGRGPRLEDQGQGAWSKMVFVIMRLRMGMGSGQWAWAVDQHEACSMISWLASANTEHEHEQHEQDEHEPHPGLWSLFLWLPLASVRCSLFASRMVFGDSSSYILYSDSDAGSGSRMMLVLGLVCSPYNSA